MPMSEQDQKFLDTTYALWMAQAECAVAPAKRQSVLLPAWAFNGAEETQRRIRASVDFRGVR